MTEIIDEKVIEEINRILKDGDRAELIKVKDGVKLIQIRRKEIKLQGCKEVNRNRLAYWKNIGCDMICSDCGFSCNDPYYLGKALFCPECGCKMTRFGTDSDGNPIQTDKNNNPI